MSLTLILGLPGSGKTTIAKSLVAQYSNLVRINKDDIRVAILSDRDWCKRSEAIVKACHTAAFIQSIKDGFDVVCDDAGLIKTQTRQELIDVAQSISPEIEIVVNDDLLAVPIAECVRRDSMRDRSVGQAVIESFQPYCSQYKSDYLTRTGFIWFPKSISN